MCLCSQVDVPQSANGATPEPAQLSCLNHLTDLVEVIKNKLPQGGSACEEGAQLVNAMVEDSQLRGFLPLQSCHDKLKFDQPSGQVRTALSSTVHVCYMLVRSAAARNKKQAVT